MNVEVPPIEEVRVDGSAAIFFASAVIAGPEVPKAVTTFVAKASPPSNVGGGRSFSVADVFVIEAPSAPNSTTNFLIAAAGSDAALEPRSVSELEAVSTGVKPPQNAVNQAAL